MSAILATTRSKLSIGALITKDNPVLADFTGDTTYELVDGVKNLGSFGDTRQLITSDQVNSGRTKKVKGTANAGTLEVTADRAPNDEGQIAMTAASESDGRYNIKLEIPAGANKFDTYYFPAYVMSNRINLGGANSVQEIVFTLELDDKPLYVAPV